ncbi:hypothetical protein NX059_010267 [Plenodomus lindquistii]|nr:hypothetical protein NX059_010267 [Plenodomus lindquistii]
MATNSSSTSEHPKPSAITVTKSLQGHQHHALSTKSLKAALKKPFQGWSMDLMRARDDDDDDYNFASGARRGAGDFRNDR